MALGRLSFRSIFSGPAAHRRKRAASASAIIATPVAPAADVEPTEFSSLPSASTMPITLELSASNLEARNAKTFVGRLKAVINSLKATIKNNPYASGTIISLSAVGVLTGVFIGLSILVPPVGAFTAAALAAVAAYVGISGVATLSVTTATVIGSAMFGVAALLVDGLISALAKGISMIVSAVKLHRAMKALDLGKSMFVPFVDATLPVAPALAVPAPAVVAGVDPGPQLNEFADQMVGGTIDLTSTVRFRPEFLPAPAATGLSASAATTLAAGVAESDRTKKPEM
jgi:hypothetical protein